MTKNGPKRLVYRYNGSPDSEEVEEDTNGELETPMRHGFVNRKGKAWRVTEVATIHPKLGAIPEVRVFLTDRF